MSHEFGDLSGAGDRPRHARRRSVRMFLMGAPADVEETIAELHTKQFGEASLWSKPLRCPDSQNQFRLNLGEVMRVYKRYLTR